MKRINRLFTTALISLAATGVQAAQIQVSITNNAPAGGGSVSFDIGAVVYDAGTEVNDFTTSAGNGLFPGLPPMQGAANTGADENGTVHEVLNPYGNFLNTPAGFDFTNLDFSAYPNGIATVTISAVPVPAAAWLMASGLIGLLAVARRAA